MASRLAEARTKFDHMGDRGTAGAEAPFRDFLRDYLPRNLSIGQGEIIDTKESRSGQTDVVIAAEDHPFLFTADAPGLFLIEGIAAAGEVKTVLTGDELTKALKNASRFRTLVPAHVKGSMINATPSDIPRFYDGRPYFLVAFESQLTTETMVQRVIDFETEQDCRTFDAVFLLGRGWAINFGDGQGAFRFGQPGGSSETGWVYNDIEEVLFDLLVWLSAVIPRILRFRPISQLYL